MPDISVPRLYLLRAIYLLLAVGQGMQVWPRIVLHSGDWSLMPGVVKCMLGALSLIALLGLRYPLRMLPLLFWEIAWKLIWLAAVALPAWRNGTVDADIAQTAFETGMVVIIIAAVPWDHVFRRYVRERGEPWRGPDRRSVR